MKRVLQCAVAAGLVLAAGCSTCRVEAWGNSDSDDPQVYSPRVVHHVHVGEIAQFRILVQPDVAAYVVMECGGQTYMLEKVEPGYAFAKRFDERWLDRPCSMEARAYKQIGKPDYLVEGGTARKLEGNDPPDQLLGIVRFQVICYQSRIVIPVTTPDGREPDWTKATLEIFGADNRVATLKLARNGSEGFTALGRNAWGEYPVFYEPKFDLVRRTGKTRAVLTYRDAAGQKELKREIWFDTP